jgi:lincosamide nucleotidyltransferase A/C/D/E
MTTYKPSMPPETVIEIIQLLNDHQIDVILDGGWAVDALIGKQTRNHDDLDLAVFHKDVAQVRTLLEEQGYFKVPRDDSWECNFVLGNNQGHLVDIHSCSFDDEGKNIFGVKYPYESLQGCGIINGVHVRCITPGWLVEFHTGYPLDEGDFHDVSLLCKKFDIPPPDQSKGFLSQK